MKLVLKRMRISNTRLKILLAKSTFLYVVKKRGVEEFARVLPNEDYLLAQKKIVAIK